MNKNPIYSNYMGIEFYVIKAKIPNIKEVYANNLVGGSSMDVLEQKEFIQNLCTTLEDFRIKNNLSQSAMGKKINVSQSTYNRLVSGDYNCNGLYAFYLFCKLSNKTMCEVVGDKSSDAYLSTAFKSLPKFRQKTVLNIIELESQLQMSDRYGNDYVDCYSLTNDNCDNMVYDAASYEPVNISGYKEICPDTIDCAIKIHSNHFHPTFHEDDILLIHQGPPRNGDTGIFINRKTKRVFFRRFIQGDVCKLEPVTPYGKTITVNPHDINDMSQWIKFGYVMTRMR